MANNRGGGHRIGAVKDKPKTPRIRLKKVDPRKHIFMQGSKTHVLSFTDGGITRCSEPQCEINKVLTDAGRRIQLDSPYHQYKRGKFEGVAYIHLKNGATGTVVKRLSSGVLLIKWDDLELEIPILQNWVKPAYELKRI